MEHLILFNIVSSSSFSLYIYIGTRRTATLTWSDNEYNESWTFCWLLVGGILIWQPLMDRLDLATLPVCKRSDSRAPRSARLRACLYLSLCARVCLIRARVRTFPSRVQLIQWGTQTRPESALRTRRGSGSSGSVSWDLQRIWICASPVHPPRCVILPAPCWSGCCSRGSSRSVWRWSCPADPGTVSGISCVRTGELVRSSSATVPQWFQLCDWTISIRTTICRIKSSIPCCTNAFLATSLAMWLKVPQTKRFPKGPHLNPFLELNKHLQQLRTPFISLVLNTELLQHTIWTHLTQNWPLYVGFPKKSFALEDLQTLGRL